MEICFKGGNTLENRWINFKGTEKIQLTGHSHSWDLENEGEKESRIWTYLVRLIQVDS
jgi:hypothetical protein